MIELLAELGGWLGYLARPAVLLQLLLVVLPLLLLPLRRNPSREARGRRSQRLLALACMALGCLLLALLQQPFGLALLLLLGWHGLTLLEQGLGRLLPPVPLHRLQQQLIRPAYLLLAVLALVDLFGNPQQMAMIVLGQWFGTPVNLGLACRGGVVLALLLVGSGPLTAALAWMLQRMLGFSTDSRRALATVLRYLVIGLGLALILRDLGLSPTAIVAIAGGLSVGLGFGVKEVFSNFVSGLWLLFEGSVRPGDVLVLNGETCEVRHLGLRAAILLRFVDNAELVVPNQTFFTSTTTSFTHSDRLRRARLLLRLPAHYDPASVQALLLEIALGVPGVLATPVPVALVVCQRGSLIEYSLQVWMADPRQHGNVCSALWTALHRHLRHDGLKASPDAPAARTP
ncbi:MAG: mechanosensitive ion channel domain-containing protein [Synechococcaceae cyanobacterium]|nr:mechanosensitive ion channel domain-containing protein [Synechococcaceae cyanobacterium]